MQEDGIDISNQISNNIDKYRDFDFDFFITVCYSAKKRYPYSPTKAKKFHQNFPNPTKAAGIDGEISTKFRKVRQGYAPNKQR